MYKEVKGQDEGKCPICHSENIIYGSTVVEENQLGYEINCQDCGNNSLEWYTLNYIETIGEIWEDD